MSKFEIVRPEPDSKRNVSIKVPVALLTGGILPRGTFLMRDTADTADPKQAALATALAIGCLTRDVLTSGVSVIERAGVFPGRLEQADQADQQCSLRPLPEAIEVEGSDYIILSGAGTGYIDANTAINTALSFLNGKIRVAQTNDVKVYNLSGKPTAETSGNIRSFCEKLQ